MIERLPTATEIFDTVCEFRYVDVEDTQRDCRKHSVLHARDVVRWLLYEILSLSQVEIANFLKGRRAAHHTAMIYVRRAKEAYEGHPAIRVYNGMRELIELRKKGWAA